MLYCIELCHAILYCIELCHAVLYCVSAACDGINHCPHICVGYQLDGRTSCICADGYTLTADLHCESECYFKHILFFSTNGLGVARMRCKPFLESECCR